MVSDAATTPRARRRVANLSRILDAALEIVAEDGLAGLSMGRLADACDYTAGALYRYYPSKDALVAALVSRVLGELSERAQAARSGYEQPLERVIAGVWSYRLLARDMPYRFSLIALLLAAPDRQLPEERDAEPVMQAMITALTPLAGDLAAAFDAGAFDEGAAASSAVPRTVLERTVVLFASLHGVLSLHKQASIAPHLIDLDRVCEVTVSSLLLGWGAEPAAVEAAIERVLGPRAVRD